jgi:hypothetical protein
MLRANRQVDNMAKRDTEESISDSGNKEVEKAAVAGDSGRDNLFKRCAHWRASIGSSIHIYFSTVILQKSQRATPVVESLTPEATSHILTPA